MTGNRARALGAAAWLALMAPAPGAAETFRAAGLSFSDELGGLRLLSVSGAGSRGDPLVIVEELTGPGPAVLLVRARARASEKGEVIVRPAFLTLVVIKIVINGTPRSWGGFDLELREVLELPSPYDDGLSFDQLGTFGREPMSDRFSGWRRVAEPYDRIGFSGGWVAPGESVRFDFQITDPTTSRVFYLLQDPQVPIAAAPGRLATAGVAPAPQR